MGLGTIVPPVGSGAKPESTNDLVHIGVRAAVFDFSKNKCIETHKKCSWVQFITGTCHMRSFSWGSCHHCPMAVGAFEQQLGNIRNTLQHIFQAQSAETVVGQTEYTLTIIFVISSHHTGWTKISAPLGPYAKFTLHSCYLYSFLSFLTQI